MKSFFTGIVAVLLIASPAWAEPLHALSLSQALAVALQNNPQVKAVQARLGVSEAEIVTAGARLNPSVLSDNGIAEKTYRLGIEQTLELGGKRRNRVALAKAQQEVLRAEIETLLLDLRTGVRRAYTHLYTLQAQEQNAQETLQTTHRLLSIAQKREKAGDVATVDVLQAEIVSVNARNDLQIVHAQVLQARNTLNALLNQPLDTELALAPPGLLPQNLSSQSKAPVLQGGVSQAVAGNLSDLIQTALAHRPELHQNGNSLLVTGHQRALAQANRIPNLTLAVGPDWVSEGSAINAFIIGNLTLPILNRQKGPLLEASARQNQLQHERAALINQITLEVTNAYFSLNANLERVSRYETELLPKSERVLAKSCRSFEEGKAAILLPLNAQQAYVNTRLGYLQALQDVQNAQSDLERAIGAAL